MSYMIEARIHNRFDFEVRNAKTLELKQTAMAENILLERIYTRLLAYNNFFACIHFGTGTGALDSSRTALFSPLGLKEAQDHEIVKAYPISKCTRKITLNSSEYVGSILSEVGISDSSTVINTHALITDAEGIPIVINKTALDVIIIYATVFIELQNLTTGAFFSDLPNDNFLLNYLVGEPMSNALTFYTGASYDTNGIRGVDIPLSEANSAIKTIDADNKKIIYSVKYEIDEGNGDVSEFAIGNIIGCKLPSEGIFTQKQLTDVKVGIGNGINKRFIIPNKHINKASLAVKVDAIANAAYVTEDLYNVYSLSKPYRQISSYTTALSATYIEVSVDGQYIAICISGTRQLWVYRCSGDSIYLINNAYTIPGCVKLKFSVDSKFLFFGSSTTNMNTGAFEINENVITRIEDFPTTETSYTGYICTSIDGNYMITDNGYVYKKVDGIWTYVTNFGIEDFFKMYISPDSKYFAFYSGNNNYYWYQLNVDGTFTDVTTSIKAVFGFDYHMIQYGGDRTHILIYSEQAPYNKVFKYDAGTFSQLTTDIHDYSFNTLVSYDGDLIIRYYDYSVEIYKKSNNSYSLVDTIIRAGYIDACISFSNDAIITADYTDSSTINISIYQLDAAGIKLVQSIQKIMPNYGMYHSLHSNKIFIFKSDQNNGLSYYKLFKDALALDFTNAPVNTAVIEADYSVNYIPKDNEHVLDLTYEIIFGSN